MACIPITEPFCQLTNTLDFMSQTRLQFIWPVGQGQMKVHTAQPCRRDRLQIPRARRIACWTHIRYKLIMDNDSDRSLHNVVAMDKEFCEDILLEPHVRPNNPYTACFTAQAPLSLDSPHTSDNDDHDQGGVDPDKTTTKLTVNTALSPSEEYGTHIYRWPKRKE